MKPRARFVTFYVEPPEDHEQDEDSVERILKAAMIAVPGWPNFGFRGEVVNVQRVPEEGDVHP